MQWYGKAAVITVLPVGGPEGDDDAYLLRLGQTIQRIRTKILGITQEEMASRIGIDHNTLSRWERGETSLSAYNLSRVWRGLNVPAEWLLNPTDSMSELDRRIAQLRQAASEAARGEAADDDRRDDGERGPRPGKPRA